MNDINIADLDTFLEENKISVEKNVDLKSKTWISRGGEVKYWIQPRDIQRLEQIVLFLYNKNIFFETVGHTSNMYFLNTYNPDIIICTKSLTKFEDNDTEIVCDCGVSISRLAREAVGKGYEGYEGLVALPGTVASAIYNNSGCRKCLVSDLFLKADFITSKGDRITLYPENMFYKERSSVLKRKELKGVILKVYLKKNICNDTEQLKRTAEANMLHRQKYQEGKRLNLGSVFPSSLIPRAYRSSFFLLMMIRIITRLSLKEEKKRKIIKELFLLVHNKRKLSKYISIHTINCFIWKDEEADSLFFEYKKFLGNLINSDVTEIEIKDGTK